MIITEDDEEEISQLKMNLFKEFEMKDLGALKYFLGIEVMRSKQSIFINQWKYVLDILAETGMIDCKPATLQWCRIMGYGSEKELSGLIEESIKD